MEIAHSTGPTIYRDGNVVCSRAVYNGGWEKSEGVSARLRPVVSAHNNPLNKNTGRRKMLLEGLLW